MWKKLSVMLLSAMLVFSFVGVDFADAKGYRSPKRSISTPAKPSNNATTPGAQTPNTGAVKQPAASTTPAGGTAAAPKRGGFFGGGLMTGLFAGMLFGSLFAGMGAFGNILGLLMNVLIIFAIIMAVRKLFAYFRNRNRYNDNPRRY